MTLTSDPLTSFYQQTFSFPKGQYILVVWGCACHYMQNYPPVNVNKVYILCFWSTFLVAMVTQNMEKTHTFET